MAVIKTVLFSDSALFPARIFFRRIAQFFHNGIHNNDTIRYAHVSFSTRALSLCLPAAEQEEYEIAYDKPLPTTTIEIVTLHFFFFLLRGYGEAEFFFSSAQKGTRGTRGEDGWRISAGTERALPERKRSIDSLTYEIRDFYEAAGLRGHEWAHMHAGLGSLKFNYTRWVENNPLTLACRRLPRSLPDSEPSVRYTPNICMVCVHRVCNSFANLKIRKKRVSLKR